MFEKFRRSLKTKKNQESSFSFKTIVAYMIFGAIILVFALFGITPDRMGSDLGGNAALVNGEAISVASFRRQFDMIQSSSGLDLNQFPPSQRDLFARELKRRTLEQMILKEGIFQKAKELGVHVSDEELRRAITSIPSFQDKGRFQRSRYEAYLQGTNQTSSVFEREIRKELLAQRMQDLFMASNSLSTEVTDGLKSLDQVEVSFRYASVNTDDLADQVRVPSSEVDQVLSEKSDEVRALYEKKKLDYFSPEKVKARHILIAMEQNDQSKEVAQKKLAELQKELTVENFSEMAKKYSDDPGSKAKGGDLGFFEKGRMVPAFEEVAFKMKPGIVSEPVQTEFGYHVILVDKKEEGGQKPFEAVQKEVAKAYLASTKVSSLMEELKSSLAEGKGAASRILSQLNVKWEKVDKVTLGEDSVAGISDSEKALRLIASRKGELGLVPEVKNWAGESYIFDLTSWKSKKVDKEVNTASYSQRLAGEAFQKWIVSLNETMKVERNARLLE